MSKEWFYRKHLIFCEFPAKSSHCVILRRGFSINTPWLYAHGYATRWLGCVKGIQPDPNHIIGIAFGKPSEPATRKPDEFKRKPLSEIAKGTDKRFEAVRLAPSEMNGQPWYFVTDGDKIHVYYKPSLGGLAGKLYNLTDLDVGIALCHLAVARNTKASRLILSYTRTEHRPRLTALNMWGRSVREETL